MLGTMLLVLSLLISPRAARAAQRRIPHPEPAVSNADRDGDGIPDVWERNGVLVDAPAGPRWIDLPAMGADPDRPDVFLQIDWMADASHDQRPDPAAIRLVVDAFRKAPYRSPTGSTGIALHVDAGPESLLAAGRPWGYLSRARELPWQDNLGTFVDGSYDWGAFLRMVDRPGGFRETGRSAVFHYAIFGHYHDRDNPDGSGASGIARGIGGTELLITLGNFTRHVGTPREQAGALMHELGHNLGLRHGGCDDVNFKPDYASIMNYAYQMAGLKRGGERDVLDFAHGPALALSAPLGEGTGGLLAPRRKQAPGTASTAPGAVPSGTPVKADLGPQPVGSGSCGDMDAFDDWAAIRLKVGGIGDPRGVTLLRTPE